MRRLQAALLAIVAALCVSAALSSGASAAPTSITEFPVDVGHASDLEGLAVGSDGNVWFQNHWWPDGAYHALIGRMDEAGNVEEFDEGLHQYSSPTDFVAGPDGNVWFADDGSAIGGSAIGRVTSDGTITRFTAGLGGARPRTIVVGPDGNLWFTSLQGTPAIGFATPAGEITTFSLPGSVRDAVGGPDGNVWFTYGDESAAPAIGRVVTKEGGGATITLFHTGLAADSWPGEIVAGLDGHLWFSDLSETPAIGRVSTSGGIQRFSTGNPASSIWHIAAGPNGDVWFTDTGANNVGRVTPQGQLTEFGEGELDETRHITPGPDGNMWFTYWGGIGKVTPAGVVTRFGRPSVNPQEIVSGPNGRLWFIANSSPIPAIGRIVPGDDTPPSRPQPTNGPTPPSFLPGRLALEGKSPRVSRRGRTVLRLACHSSTPCSGRIRLVGHRRNWKAGRTLWASSFHVPAWGSAGIRVQLSRVGREILAEKRVLMASLSTQPNAGVLPLSEWLQLRPRAR